MAEVFNSRPDPQQAIEYSASYCKWRGLSDLFIGTLGAGMMISGEYQTLFDQHHNLGSMTVAGGALIWTYFTSSSRAYMRQYSEILYPTVEPADSPGDDLGLFA